MRMIAADRRRSATGLIGSALLTGLALALIPGAPSWLAVVIAAVGVLGAAAVLLGDAIERVRRQRSLWLVLVAVALTALWVDIGLSDAHLSGPSPIAGVPSGALVQASSFEFFPGNGALWAWPWRVDRTSLLPLGLLLLCVVGGLVLLSDAVRVQLGLATVGRSPWRLLTTPLERRSRIAWRVIPSLVLIVAGAFLAIGLANPYLQGHGLLQGLALVLVWLVAATLVGAPLVIGSLMTVNRDKAGRAREEERRRFAAHLHDSVLQTLALVQRQAHDPAAVVRLARRQEFALRAWMAGEAELASETLGAALREVVAAVEDEYEITFELTAIGDRPLDPEGEALVAAAREALRNAAHHAPGAPVFVFAEIAASRVEVFVRDEGPGFDPEAVSTERRGIRDALIGRMALVGGRATIDSTLGEGTEVALQLGAGVR
jgi:signal transduction histidine kinase